MPFSPACTDDFNRGYTPGIVGAVFIPINPGPVFVTLDQPVITLVSSVTTSAVPEPPAASLVAAFARLCAFVLQARRRRTA